MYVFAAWEQFLSKKYSYHMIVVRDDEPSIHTHLPFLPSPLPNHCIAFTQALFIGGRGGLERSLMKSYQLKQIINYSVLLMCLLSQYNIFSTSVQLIHQCNLKVQIFLKALVQFRMMDRNNVCVSPTFDSKKKIARLKQSVFVSLRMKPK